MYRKEKKTTVCCQNNNNIITARLLENVYIHYTYMMYRCCRVCGGASVSDVRMALEEHQLTVHFIFFCHRHEKRCIGNKIIVGAMHVWLF